MKEVDLIALYAQGDQKAFADLYAIYSPPLLQKLYQMVADEETILEIHQVAFVRLWDYRDRIEVKPSIYGLLLHIAKNLVVDHYRKIASDERLKKQLLAKATLYYQLDEPDDQLDEMTDALLGAVNKLPPKRKDIFLLCKLHGKTYEQVADMQSVSLGTVKDHMAKAMRFLKNELGDKTFSTLLILISLMK